MMMMVSEGRTSVQRNQERMSRIRELKEQLQKEEIRLQETHRDSDQSHATSMVSDQSGDTEEKETQSCADD